MDTGKTSTPAERVAALYAKVPCVRTFREDLEAHLLNGYVFSTPEVFVMGRAVRRNASAEEICDPWHVFPEADWDTWLVYAYAGDLKAGLQFLPRPLPYLAWQRVKEKSQRLKIYSTEKVLKRISESNPSPNIRRTMSRWDFP